MSKLDWFTILVIAVCVLAIGALIWNAKNLFQDTNRQAANTDISEDYTDTSADDAETTYDINVDGDGDGDNGANTNGAVDGGQAIHSDSDIAREAAEADAEEARMAEREAAEVASRDNSTSRRINTNTSPNSSGGNGISTNSGSNTGGGATTAAASKGNFMVLIGSYTQMISAERMLRSVRSKGYRSASIEKFNNGKYARILVDRRKTLNSARDLQAELVSDGFRDIIIKEK